jgi:hypothetical protein
MKILIRDNYFEDPDLIRNMGLSHTKYRVNNSLAIPPTSWRGQRTPPLRKLNNPILDGYAEDIFNICHEYFDLDNFVFPYDPENPAEEFTITTYFHITTEETRNAFPDFWQDRFHKDFDTAAAGVVYLNPDAPLNSGTSVFDARNNKMVNVENKYNRLVAYEGTRIHALSDVFGDSLETGRMTFTFFIHEVQSLDIFEENEIF